MAGPIYNLAQPVASKVEGATLLAFPDVGTQLAKIVEQTAKSVPVSANRGNTVNITA